MSSLKALIYILVRQAYNVIAYLFLICLQVTSVERIRNATNCSLKMKRGKLAS